MAQAPVVGGDDTSTPVLVCGVLAGLTGGALGMLPPGIAALVRGDGIGHPNRLVASSLMGSDAFVPDNAFAATMLGALFTLIAAGLAGALFAWLRRREMRVRLLLAEGLGFGLVMLGAVRIGLPMLVGGWTVVSVVSFLVFGACLALELPLRVGSLDVGDAERVRESLDEA